VLGINDRCDTPTALPIAESPSGQWSFQHYVQQTMNGKLSFDKRQPIKVL